MTDSDSDAQNYYAAHARSIDDPDAFWLEVAEGIDWVTAPTRAVDGSRPPFYKWFPDGELNTSANCLDRHVDAGRGEQAAYITTHR